MYGRGQFAAVEPFTMGRVFRHGDPRGKHGIHKEVSDTAGRSRNRDGDGRLAVARLSVFPSGTRATTSRAFVIVVSVGRS